MTIRLTSFAICACLAAPAGAHPHIFVDTGLDLSFDAQGRLAEIRVTWAYDDFYSLLIIEDRGLDPDFDGTLTDAELRNLTGFDMQWTEGFNGDLVVEQNGDRLAMSGPLRVTAQYEQGRITTTHVRRVEPDQTAGAEFEIRPYDATYYTAYDVSLPVTLRGGSGCTQRLETPDIDTQLLKLRDELNALDVDIFPEDVGVPDIGILLSSTVRVICDVS